MKKNTPNLSISSTAWWQTLIINLLLLLILGLIFRDSWRTFLAIAGVAILGHLATWLLRRRQRSRRAIHILRNDGARSDQQP